MEIRTKTDNLFWNIRTNFVSLYLDLFYKPTYFCENSFSLYNHYQWNYKTDICLN